MIIREIWVPQMIVVILLAVPLLRPLLARNRSRMPRTALASSGLAWLSFVALGICVAIFPAYGFRPESLPILIFALLVNICNVLAASRKGVSFRTRIPFVQVLALIALTAVSIPMFALPSRAFDEQHRDTKPYTLRLVSHDKQYSLRIYQATDTRTYRPIIFLVPPDIGSADSVDIVSTRLQEQGFTVVSYVREDYDARGFTQLLQYWRITRMATRLASFNEMGKKLEAERRADIAFLLPRMGAVLGRGQPLLLLGYGSGGSVLAYMAGEGSFASEDNVRGVIAVESHLWSAWQDEPRLAAPEIPAGGTAFIPRITGWLRHHWVSLGIRLHNLRPQRVLRTGPLPGAGETPVLYLVSGQALRGRHRPYQAVFDSLRSGSGSRALAAIESAGPLDYQDIPYTYPIYSFLLPGLRGALPSENPINDTTAIIDNFASYLLGVPPRDGEASRQAIRGRLYIESRGLPAFRLE